MNLKEKQNVKIKKTFPRSKMGKNYKTYRMGLRSAPRPQKYTIKEFHA